MVGHQVLLVYRFDGGGERLPDFWLDVALDVAADDPDDVLTVFVAVGQEPAIGLGLLHAELPALHETAPDTYHPDIDVVAGCRVDDVVHVIPVGVGCVGKQSPLTVVRRRTISVE